MSKLSRRLVPPSWSDAEWDTVSIKVMELSEANPDCDLWTITNAAQGQVLPVSRHRVFTAQDHGLLLPLYKRLGLTEKGEVPPPPPPPPPPPKPPVPPATVTEILGRPIETKSQPATGLTQETVKTWIKEHGTAGFLLEEIAEGFSKILNDIKAGREEIANFRKDFETHVANVNLEIAKIRQECEERIEKQTRGIDKVVADTKAVHEITLAMTEDWEKLIMTVVANFRKVVLSIGMTLGDTPGQEKLAFTLAKDPHINLLTNTGYEQYVAVKTSLETEKTTFPNHTEPPIVVAVVGPREVDFKHIQEKVKDIGVTVHLLPADDAIKIPKDVTAVFISTRFAHNKLGEVRNKFKQHIVPVPGGISSMVGSIGQFAKEVITARRSQPEPFVRPAGNGKHYS